MTREERAKKKAEYTGPRYKDRMRPGQVGKPCEECGVQIYWVKTPAGAWMPVEYDGIPHWGFCTNPGRFSKRRRPKSQGGGFVEGVTRGTS